MRLVIVALALFALPLASTTGSSPVGPPPSSPVYILGASSPSPLPDLMDVESSPSPTPSPDDDDDTTMGIIAGAASGVGVFIGLMIAARCMWRRPLVAA